MFQIQTICRNVRPLPSLIASRGVASTIRRGEELPNEYQRDASPTKRHILRWLNLRKSLWYKFMSEDVNDLRYLSPFTILDMSQENDALDVRCAHPSDRYGGWRISDDEVIGGNSRADVSYVDDGKTQAFLRWSGTIDTSVPVGGKHVDRSGFCNIRSPSLTLFGSPKLIFNAIEITCRVRELNRNILVNLTIDSFLEDNIYQAILQPNRNKDEDVNEFKSYVLPFRHFLQTYGGRIRANQMKIDNEISIEHIGFTLGDGIDGDFCFDLATIRACNLYKGDIIY